MPTLTPEQQAELAALMPHLKSKLTAHSGGPAKHLTLPSLPGWLAALIIQLLEGMLTSVVVPPPAPPTPAPSTDVLPVA